MFRIKKDDYNTVQFLPDCKSSGRPRKPLKYQKPAPPVKSKVVKEKRNSGGGVKTASSGSSRKILWILLILLIVIAVGAWIGYSQYFSPKAQFIRAFTSEDYTHAADIANTYKNDSNFKKGIRSTVKGEVDEIMDQYMGGKLIATKTLDALDQVDNGSANLFKKYVDKSRMWLDTVETIYYLSDVAGYDALNKKYEDAMINLFEVERLAKENGLILDARITDILNSNMDGLKPYLFIQFSNTIRNENDYSSIINTCEFMCRYIQDDDFIEYPSIVQKVKDGSYTKLAAAREARAIAKEAGANIEINEGSGKAPAVEKPKKSSDSDSSSGNSGKSSGSSGSSSSSGKSSRSDDDN